MLVRNQGVRTGASPLSLLVLNWPVSANSNIGIRRVTCPTRRTSCTASCQPSLDLIQVPHHTFGRQIEALREFSAPLHLVDCRVCKRHDLSQLASADCTQATAHVVVDWRCGRFGNHGLLPPDVCRRRSIRRGRSDATISSGRQAWRGLADRHALVVPVDSSSISMFCVSQSRTSARCQPTGFPQ